VATYLHAIHSPRFGALAEGTHDIDLYLPIDALTSLRQTDNVVANARLNKQQIIRNNVEVDVYIEHQHKLVVPFEDANTQAVTYGETRVACLEHLLPLKMEAFGARSASTKGDKDARDVARIGCIAGNTIRTPLVMRYLRREHLAVLNDIAKSEWFVDLARGNKHEARKLRSTFGEFLLALNVR
jgi:hypothetical protein